LVANYIDCRTAGRLRRDPRALIGLIWRRGQVIDCDRYDTGVSNGRGDRPGRSCRRQFVHAVSSDDVSIDGRMREDALLSGLGHHVAELAQLIGQRRAGLTGSGPIATQCLTLFLIGVVIG
jgi:hypothetical protein